MKTKSYAIHGYLPGQITLVSEKKNILFFFLDLLNVELNRESNSEHGYMPEGKLLKQCLILLFFFCHIIFRGEKKSKTKTTANKNK